MENYLKATRNDWKVESSDPAFQANPLLWSQDKQTHRREQFFICRMMNVVANLFVDLKEPFKFWKFQISKLDELFDESGGTLLCIEILNLKTSKREPTS